MNQLQEISGNHIIWHRKPSAGQSDRRSPVDYLLGKKRLVVQGSLGHDIYFDSLVIPERARKLIWLFLLFLVSLRFYLVRELVAGLLLITAFTFAASVPVLALLAVYKAGRNLTQRVRLRSLAMDTRRDSIRTMSVSDLQLEELLCRLAVNQKRTVIMPSDSQQTSREGLFLIRELPGRAS